MHYLQKIQPEWPLRLGLGLMYIYSGYDLFASPQNWLGFAPSWFLDIVTSFISVESYLRMQGAGEFVIGLLLLAWFGGKWGVRIASIAATAEMLLIIIFVGVDIITFRDVGLLGAALALLILAWRGDTPDETQPAVQR